MKSIVIYHNPKCSKSRKTLEYIKGQNITPKIKLYLQEEITVTEIKDLIKKVLKSHLMILFLPVKLILFYIMTIEKNINTKN